MTVGTDRSSAWGRYGGWDLFSCLLRHVSPGESWRLTAKSPSFIRIITARSITDTDRNGGADDAQ